MNVDSLIYEFSDGFISKASSFSHRFDSAGVYWRKLTLYNNQGCEKIIYDSAYITLSAPKAKADLVQDTFCVPNTVKMIQVK